MAKSVGSPVGNQRTRTYRAQTAALTRGYAVKQGTADDQAVIAGANDRILGVVNETIVNVGDALSVVKGGETIAIAGGAVNAGDIVKSDANGKFIAGNAADVETGGKAVTGAAADLDEFVLDVMPVHKRS